MSIKTAGDRELVAAVYPFLQEQGFDQTAESFTSAEATFPDTIQVYHAEQQRLQDLAASLTTQFPSLSVTVHHLPNELWQNSWQRETGSFATEKFRVVWDGDPASLPVDDRMTFDLRDATAFGNGQHATTQACLEQLETYPGSRAQRFLDIGAGTGILAMAAHALGYGTIVATDIDEQAVVDSRMFFERYGVTGQVLQGT